MEIDGRSGDVGGKTLYTGLVNVIVEAVNPTMKQMQDLGYSPQVEPDYIGVTDEGNAKAVVDFYLKDPDSGARGKIRFWLENTNRKTRDGNKYEWIDDHAKTSFSEDIESVPAWISKETARKALVGEGMLLSFITAWANVNPFPDAEGKIGVCKFKDINKLFSNDLSEIKSILENDITKDNKVKVLFNVITTESGKEYQDVYRHYFGREMERSTKMWTKRLQSDYSECRGDYQNSLKFQKYNPDVVVEVATPDTEVETTGGDEDNPW